MGRPTSKVTNVRVAGPLAPFVGAYKVRLRDRGYTPLTVVNELRQVAHVSRWLEASGMGAAELTRERLEQFVVARRRSRSDHGACSLQGLLPLLEVLGELGVVAAERPAPPLSAAEALVGSFRRHLIAERGVSSSTADAYVLRARRFLAACAPDGAVQALTTGDVTSAVLHESAAVSVGAVQLFVVALRAFLRFCFLEGLIETDLSGAALAMTGRRRSSLPKGIGRSAATALLRSCDRRKAIGRRDYAVILTLLRLGLRAGEVAALRLDDIDWRAGEIVVHGKGGRLDRLPLPADAGEAIAAYLQRGRPRVSRREVFLRALAPITALERGGVSTIVRRACVRAGIPAVGSHRLRHTVACEMVAAGVALAEIGEVLRHRSTASTATYARLDLDALRQLALPWPGGEPR